MKTFKQIQIQHEVLVKKICDVCKISESNNKYNWPKDHFRTDIDESRINQIEISHRVGASFPDDSWWWEFEIDCCPSCFWKVVIPALKQAGVKVQYIDRDKMRKTLEPSSYEELAATEALWL